MKQDPLASLGVSLLSGAIAGVAAALVSQPADVLLSKVAQGGDEDTFIFMLGVRRFDTMLGSVDIVEGVFLSESGQGFRATWDHQQLMGETERGGWTVIPVDEVRAEWTDRVERRMNRS